MKNQKYIVMLGTAFETMGGISAVVQQYRSAGLFEHFPLIYLPSHCDGNSLRKIKCLLICLCRYSVLLLTGKISLVHVHMASGASFWRKAFFLVMAIVFNVKTILHLHGAEFQTFYGKRCGRPAQRLIRFLFLRVNAVVVLSRSWEQWVLSVAERSSVVVISNPVFVPPLPATGRRDGSTIISLGRLGTRKGTFDLIAAVASLIPRHPDLHLVLAGDGQLEEARREATALGIGAHVDIRRWVSGEDKRDLFESAAIYALPSYAEGLPMSVLEAMAYGLPVVSTPVGGIPEAITDNQHGYLVAPGDTESLTQALDRLLSDPTLSRQMGLAAHMRAEEKFSVQRVVLAVENLYRSILSA